MESYVKLDQLGEGSYATVYKGYSKYAIPHHYVIYCTVLTVV